MQQLDFDKFELIKELLKNRVKIVWCTRLQRAQAEDEKARIEVISHFLFAPVHPQTVSFTLVPILLIPLSPSIFSCLVLM